MSSSVSVDPRAPRFGQTVTATIALVGVSLQEQILVYLLTLLLVVPVVTRWRVDPYSALWRNGVRRLFDAPDETESPIPHRFARVIGALMTTIASVCLLVAAWVGAPVLLVAGFGAAALVGVLAAVSAITGFCLGCRMYRQVSLVRGWRLLTSPAEEGRTRG